MKDEEYVASIPSLSSLICRLQTSASSIESRLDAYKMIIFQFNSGSIIANDSLKSLFDSISGSIFKDMSSVDLKIKIFSLNLLSWLLSVKLLNYDESCEAFRYLLQTLDYSNLDVTLVAFFAIEKCHSDFLSDDLVNQAVVVLSKYVVDVINYDNIESQRIFSAYALIVQKFLQWNNVLMLSLKEIWFPCLMGINLVFFSLDDISKSWSNYHTDEANGASKIEKRFLHHNHLSKYTIFTAVDVTSSILEGLPKECFRHANIYFLSLLSMGPYFHLVGIKCSSILLKNSSEKFSYSLENWYSIIVVRLWRVYLVVAFLLQSLEDDGLFHTLDSSFQAKLSFMCRATSIQNVSTSYNQESSCNSNNNSNSILFRLPFISNHILPSFLSDLSKYWSSDKPLLVFANRNALFSFLLLQSPSVPSSGRLSVLLSTLQKSGRQVETMICCFYLARKVSEYHAFVALKSLVRLLLRCVEVGTRAMLQYCHSSSVSNVCSVIKIENDIQVSNTCDIKTTAIQDQLSWEFSCRHLALPSSYPSPLQGIYALENEAYLSLPTQGDILSFYDIYLPLCAENRKRIAFHIGSEILALCVSQSCFNLEILRISTSLKLIGNSGIQLYSFLSPSLSKPLGSLTSGDCSSSVSDNLEIRINFFIIVRSLLENSISWLSSNAERLIALVVSASLSPSNCSIPLSGSVLSSDLSPLLPQDVMSNAYRHLDQLPAMWKCFSCWLDVFLRALDVCVSIIKPLAPFLFAGDDEVLPESCLCQDQHCVFALQNRFLHAGLFYQKSTSKPLKLMESQFENNSRNDNHVYHHLFDFVADYFFPMHGLISQGLGILCRISMALSSSSLCSENMMVYCSSTNRLLSWKWINNSLEEQCKCISAKSASILQILNNFIGHAYIHRTSSSSMSNCDVSSFNVTMDCSQQGLQLGTFDGDEEHCVLRREYDEANEVLVIFARHLQENLERFVIHWPDNVTMNASWPWHWHITLLIEAFSWLLHRFSGFSIGLGPDFLSSLTLKCQNMSSKKRAALLLESSKSLPDNCVGIFLFSLFIVSRFLSDSRNEIDRESPTSSIHFNNYLKNIRHLFSRAISRCFNGVVESVSLPGVLEWSDSIIKYVASECMIFSIGDINSKPIPSSNILPIELEHICAVFQYSMIHLSSMTPPSSHDELSQEMMVSMDFGMHSIVFSPLYLYCMGYDNTLCLFFGEINISFATSNDSELEIISDRISSSLVTNQSCRMLSYWKLLLNTWTKLRNMYPTYSSKEQLSLDIFNVPIRCDFTSDQGINHESTSILLVVCQFLVEHISSIPSLDTAFFSSLLCYLSLRTLLETLSSVSSNSLDPSNLNDTWNAVDQLISILFNDEIISFELSKVHEGKDSSNGISSKKARSSSSSCHFNLEVIIADNTSSGKLESLPSCEKPCLDYVRNLDSSNSSDNRIVKRSRTSSIELCHLDEDSVTLKSDISSSIEEISAVDKENEIIPYSIWNGDPWYLFFIGFLEIIRRNVTIPSNVVLRIVTKIITILEHCGTDCVLAQYLSSKWLIIDSWMCSMLSGSQLSVWIQVGVILTKKSVVDLATKNLIAIQDIDKDRYPFDNQSHSSKSRNKYQDNENDGQHDSEGTFLDEKKAEIIENSALFSTPLSIHEVNHNLEKEMEMVDNSQVEVVDIYATPTPSGDPLIVGNEAMEISKKWSDILVDLSCMHKQIALLSSQSQSIDRDSLSRASLRDSIRQCHDIVGMLLERYEQISP